MNNIAWLSLIFSLTTTSPSLKLAKNVNSGWYNNTIMVLMQPTASNPRRSHSPYDMKISRANLFVHFCVKSGILLHCILYTLQRMQSIPSLYTNRENFIIVSNRTAQDILSPCSRLYDMSDGSAVLGGVWLSISPNSIGFNTGVELLSESSFSC